MTVATLPMLLALVLDSARLSSGLQVGEAVPSWEPIHIAGPDKGTRACPVCTYGARPMILVVTKDGPNTARLAAGVERLVASAEAGELKGFVVVTGSTAARLRALARAQAITRSALCYPDPEHEQVDLRQKLKINPRVENTVLVYRKFRVTANFVNVDARDLAAVKAAVVRATEP
jgi:protocatechuate 3,4-dioxygenase beta subunit